jgi:hypothetical protein
VNFSGPHPARFARRPLPSGEGKKGAFCLSSIPENSNSLAGSSRKRRLFGVSKGAFFTKPIVGAQIAVFFQKNGTRNWRPLSLWERDRVRVPRLVVRTHHEPRRPHPRPVDRMRSTPQGEGRRRHAPPPSRPNKVQRVVSYARAANGLVPPERAKPNCQRAAASFEATIRKRQSRRASAAARWREYGADAFRTQHIY